MVDGGMVAGMSTISPSISFKDNARQALEFYQSVLGGKLQIMSYGDMGQLAASMGAPASEGNLVMHGELTLPNGMVIMAADSGSTMPFVAATRGMGIAYTGGKDDLDTISAAFKGLSDGATDVMPFGPAPWGDYYGQLVDKFGIKWEFNAAGK